MKQMEQNVNNDCIWVMDTRGLLNYHFLLLCKLEYYLNKAFKTKASSNIYKRESFIPRLVGMHTDSWTPTLTPQPPGV